MSLVEGVDAGLGYLEGVVDLDRLELEDARAREIGRHEVGRHLAVRTRGGPDGQRDASAHDLEAGARRLELEGRAEGLFGNVEDRPLGAVLARDPREELARGR